MIRFVKKIGKKSEVIGETNLKKIFKNEDEMRDWFAQNLSNIIPDLVFIDIEYLIGKKIPDTIALNPGNASEKPSFVIVEYKLNDKNKIEQVIGYRGKIVDANKYERKKLMARAWEKYYKTKQEYEAFGSLDYYDWEETKIILVNSEFEDWVIKLAENKKNGIILGKIGVIQSEKDCLYISVEGKDGKLLLNGNKKKEDSRNNRVQKSININDNEYRITWKKEASEWMEKEIGNLQEKFAIIYTENRPKSTVVDVKISKKTILTLSWKDGRLNQPKVFLVNPSNNLREKYGNIKNNLVDKKDNTFEYFLEKQQLFGDLHFLLTEFIEENIKK
ncbi:MAG: hypothetical protein I3273_07630 [Candidatus Moeniiplasma glomeromycotorum]|nr:hypothetical protein [Candidatus Moeniiplasma glomeromycotorum]MCE8168428.1 hypothetical protein [Candidatus Moeniiplasma glomeromycotorum]MCE8169950.1 hypothetical protein [Candidatus Moeniiplasma glomeromycotorum]